MLRAAAIALNLAATLAADASAHFSSLFRRKRHSPSFFVALLAMTSAAERPQILVIDDEMGPRESLRMLLKTEYHVDTADSVDGGIRLLKEKRPDTIVMDIRMPGT